MAGRRRGARACGKAHARPTGPPCPRGAGPIQSDCRGPARPVWARRRQPLLELCGGVVRHAAACGGVPAGRGRARAARHRAPPQRARPAAGDNQDHRRLVKLHGQRQALPPPAPHLHPQRTCSRGGRRARWGQVAAVLGGRGWGESGRRPGCCCCPALPVCCPALRPCGSSSTMRRWRACDSWARCRASVRRRGDPTELIPSPQCLLSTRTLPL